MLVVVDLLMICFEHFGVFSLVEHADFPMCIHSVGLKTLLKFVDTSAFVGSNVFKSEFEACNL